LAGFWRICKLCSLPDFLSKQEKNSSSETEAERYDSLEITELKKRIAELESRTKTQEKIISKTEQEQEIRREIKKYLENIQQTPSFAAPIATRDEVREIHKMEPSQQIGALISLVFEKGLTTAIQVVKETDNPAILDEFHDALIDHYYKALIDKGALKEI